jgi:hypothetical protein
VEITPDVWKSNQKPTRTNLPPTDNNVAGAPHEEGVALRCVRQQMGDNRMYLNKKEERENS